MTENYFNPRPKYDIKDLYDRDLPLSQLRRAISNKKPAIVISGLRRIGKTSLVRTFLNEIEHGIFIDMWSDITRTSISRNEVIQTFSKAINSFLKGHEKIRSRIVNKIKKLRGVNASVFGTGGGVDFTADSTPEKNLADLFDELNQWAVDNNKTIVIAIDEVQELSKATDINLGKLFASLYNNTNLILILSGSLVGTLQKFIGKKNPQSPFYGKDLTEITIEPLTDEQSREFLLKGFEQNNFPINTVLYEPIIDSAINRLGGIIGWLVIFGNKCIDNETMSEQFIDNIEEEGSPQAYQDYKAFLDTIGSPETYDELMYAMALMPYSIFNKRYGYQLDKKPYIKNLIDAKFVKYEEGRFIITDPLLRFYLLNNQKPTKQNAKHEIKKSSTKSTTKKPKRKS